MDVWIDLELLVLMVTTRRWTKFYCVIGSCSATRFRLTITADERIELDVFASLNTLARSLIPGFPLGSTTVFSIFYSFIRLFANKRIEYKVSSSKILFLFVNTNKGALIRLFDYSQPRGGGQ